MNATRWKTFRAKLPEEAAALVTRMIPEQTWLCCDTRESAHPLSRLITAALCAHDSDQHRLPPSVYRLVDNLRCIDKWRVANSARGAWWDRTAKQLGKQDHLAAGAMAEIRALGALLSTDTSPTGGLVPEPVPRGGSRTPDFRIGAGAERETYVEVACARMNDAERERQRDIDGVHPRLLNDATDALRTDLNQHPENAYAARHVSDPDNYGRVLHQLTVRAGRDAHGQSYIKSVEFTRDSRAAGRRDDPVVQATAAAVANKKPPGQTRPDRPAILWLDLIDPDWALTTQGVGPAQVRNSEASTPGVWHSFYGRKHRTFMMDRARVGLVLGPAQKGAFKQPFDGRFRQAAGRCWSAAVLHCTDGLVIFENPDASNPLDFSVLRELLNMQHCAPELSYHRFFSDDALGLGRRLEDVDLRLAFYAQ